MLSGLKIKLIKLKVIRVDKMSKYADKAVDHYNQGYNCSQSVVLAFSEHFDLEKNVALRIASSFGGGIGGQREVCGAITGMCIVLGVMYGFESSLEKSKKPYLNKAIQDITRKFKEKTKSIYCSKLLTLEGGLKDAHSEKSPCREYIRLSCDLLDDYINE